MVQFKCSFDSDPGVGNESAITLPKPIHTTGDTAIHHDRDNYGTLSSQRPVRERKRPQKLCDEIPQPSTKKQRRSQKNPTTRKPPKKRTYQRAVQSQNETKHGELAGYSDYSLESQQRKSKVVILKVPLDSRLLRISQHPSSDQHMDEERSKASSSPLSSLHSNSVGFPNKNLSLPS